METTAKLFRDAATVAKCKIRASYKYAGTRSRACQSSSKSILKI